jgi:DNA-binding response OmpR family regulator
MRSLSILVAEDEQDVRDLIVRTFEFSGFGVISVENGEEAVQEALKTKPDLILLDVRMPKMTGFEACEKLKAEERTKHIPVVFLSPYGQEAEVTTGLSLGAEEYLVKPFELGALVERIKVILRKHGKIS